MKIQFKRGTVHSTVSITKPISCKQKANYRIKLRLSVYKEINTAKLGATSSTTNTNDNLSIYDDVGEYVNINAPDK